MMKQVLVVCFDFPPQGGTGAIRATKFVKYLPQFGWNPVVVCSDTNWNPDESLSKDIPASVPVYRVSWPKWLRAMHLVPSSSPHDNRTMKGNLSPKSFLRRTIVRKARRLLMPDPGILWVRQTQRTCARVLLDHPCDVVLTTSPPPSVHFVGQWLHRHLGLPWVADFRDIWTVGPEASSPLGRLSLSLQRRMEHRFLEECNRAVMITEPVRERVLKVFGLHLGGKVTTITNGFDPEDFPSPRPIAEGDPFTIAYVGTLLGKQADNAFPEGLRRALESSEVFRNSVLVRFVGQIAPEYHARLSELGSQVEIQGFVRHDIAIDLMLRSSLLLVILPNTDESPMVYTNKFFEYLASRRPVLALVPPGLISEIVSHEKIGWVAPPDNASAIAEALLEMFEKVSVCPEGYRASDAVLSRFDRYALTRQLATVLEGATGERE